MSDFKVDGIDEFNKKLKIIEKKAPDRIIIEMDKQGNRLRREVRKNTPVVTGRLRKSYKLNQVEKQRGGYMKGLGSTAPHFHLVERGFNYHNPDGTTTWIEGTHMVEKTLKQQDGPMTRDLKKWLDTLFKELK